MKKMAILSLAVFALFSFSACGSNVQKMPSEGVIESKTQGSTDNQESDMTDNGSKILITYFTVPETDGADTVAGASRVASESGVVGNTEFIANEIQKNIGGDLFKIETVQSYPGTHDELLEFAYNEKNENARPELISKIENIDDYDIVFVGYPNWNADLPMPLYTFFNKYDFSGKTIIPFVTHGGSSFSETISVIKELEPNAMVVEEGLSVSRNNVASAESDVKEWTQALLKN